jgi:hypothetical protein
MRRNLLAHVKPSPRCPHIDNWQTLRVGADMTNGKNLSVLDTIINSAKHASSQSSLKLNDRARLKSADLLSYTDELDSDDIAFCLHGYCLHVQ